jgi:hypothetical protein
MSIALDAATKVHGKQLDAASKSQDLVVRGLEKVAALRDKSPKMHSALNGPLAKVTSPVAKVLGMQVSATHKTQGFVVQALEKTAGFGDKSPQIPSSFAGPLKKVASPVTKVFGSAKDVAAYSAASARDWFELQQSFQTAVRDALSPTRSEDA